MMNDDGFDATQDYVSRRKKAEDVLIVYELKFDKI
jgi:hypothetical protein